ncbi:ECF transporter S component [Mycoplasma sp. 888]|uniref:ECF transporter S component n=1 Tax=Mycoplasma sp. 888 TaxID=3108483 RepID=UPI002D77A66C|nr:ECF transporter S component [Mycoplasma sp. 888]WRQ25692.1 ECF transporter S component [Mycoplasma sp. 888]
MKTKVTAKLMSSLSEWGLLRKWTIKNMVFIAILIAISVSFTVVAAQLMPIVNIPSFKFSFIGLPVKITGFVFGPVIGVFVGVVSDLLSLLFVPPVGYNPMYTLATAINGLISGIFGFYFVSFLQYAFSKEYRLERISIKITLLAQKYRKLSKNETTMEKAIKVGDKLIKLNSKRAFIRDDNSKDILKNVYTTAAVFLISLVIIIITYYVGFWVPDKYIEKGLIPNRWGLLALMITGMSLLLIFIIVARFKMRVERFLIFVPIIVFSAFLELINIPILSLGDNVSLGNGESKDIFLWITQHIISSPVKIWFNVFVIYYSYSIIIKLIKKNSKLGY